MHNKVYLFHYQYYLDDTYAEIDELIEDEYDDFATEDNPMFDEHHTFEYYRRKYERMETEEMEELEKNLSSNEVYRDFICENPQSAKEVLMTAYFLANIGEFEKVKTFITKDVLEQFNDGFFKYVDGIAGIWRQATRKGTIQEIRIIDEEYRVNRVTIRSISTFINGKKKQNEDELILENGKWRIT